MRNFVITEQEEFDTDDKNDANTDIEAVPNNILKDETNNTDVIDITNSHVKNKSSKSRKKSSGLSAIKNFFLSCKTIHLTIKKFHNFSTITTMTYQ